MLDGTPNAHAQRSERQAQLAARHESERRSARQMMERKRIATERRAALEAAGVQCADGVLRSPLASPLTSPSTPPAAGDASSDAGRQRAAPWKATATEGGCGVSSRSARGSDEGGARLSAAGAIATVDVSDGIVVAHMGLASTPAAEPSSAAVAAERNDEIAESDALAGHEQKWSTLASEGLVPLSHGTSASGASSSTAVVYSSARTPPSATAMARVASVYVPSLLPTNLREPRPSWRLGAWTAQADALLVEMVRVHRFRWEAVASDLRARLRDTSSNYEPLDWSPSPRFVTAEEVRLRWAALDRQMCVHALS